MRRTPNGEFTAFMTVAEQRNFTQAAKQLGISTATLSQTIRALEERLGVRLLNRTTRSVAPTEAGEMLLARLKPVLEDYEAAIDSINQFRDKPAGLLRLTVAPPAIHSVIAPRIGEFSALYPDIRLEISVEATNVDIVANQFDAGIRLEGHIDRDMIAVRVSEKLRMAVVAAPSYLAQRGKPATPVDLQNHNCIRLRLSNGATLPWRLRGNDKQVEVHISGSLIANDMGLILAAALAGVGVIYGPREYVTRYLADGRLVPLLEEWTPLAGSWFLYYSSRRQTPAALQALIDFLRLDKKPAAQIEKKASRGV
jgi:DNA-binding transcriptional LysR family regulator